MILTGLLLGLVLGFMFQRGRFCVAGPFRDLFPLRSTRWFTAFMVSVSIQSVGVSALDALAVITLAPETFPWLGTIIGGLIFGFSIVLAGGCATGTYYRAGEGLVGSWFALIFSIVGATAFQKGPLAGTTTTVAARSKEAQMTRFRLPASKTGLAHVLTEKAWHPFVTATIVGVLAIAAWAGGCTIGNAMVSPAAFSFQGWTALVFMVLGTGLAAKLFILNHRGKATTPVGGSGAGLTSAEGAAADAGAVLGSDSTLDDAPHPVKLTPIG